MTGRRPERRLATVLFLDIVDSTRIAGEVGDARWRDVLREFRRIVRRQLRTHRGHEEDTAGDGFFATFAQPGAAIRVAAGVVAEVQRLGIDIRCGVHTGELERIDGRLGGIAAHIGARVVAQASPAEVLTTGTVREMLVGAGISFAPSHEAELKGVPGRWALFRVNEVDGAPLPSALTPAVAEARLATVTSRAGRWPMSARVAAVLVVLAAAGVVVLLPRPELLIGGAPSASPVSSAPASPAFPITMLRIDPESNTIQDEVRDIYLSIGRPAPVWIVDGTLWQGTPIQIVRRDLATGQAVSTIDRPPNAFSVLFGFGSVWFIGDPEAGVSQLVNRVDPLSGRTIATIDLGAAVRDVAVGRTAIWALTREAGVLEVDPQTNEVVDSDAVGIQTVPDAIAVVGSVLWICECDEGRLVEFDPASDTTVRTIESDAGLVLPDQRVASQGAVTLESTTVWLIDGANATVTPVDTASAEAGRSIGIPPNVWGHAFGLGSLWLAADDVVHRIDHTSDPPRITSIRMRDGVLTRAIAVDEETQSVWISNCDCAVEWAE